MAARNVRIEEFLSMELQAVDIGGSALPAFGTLRTWPKRTEAAYMDISKNTRRINRGVRDAYGTGSSRISKEP